MILLFALIGLSATPRTPENFRDGIARESDEGALIWTEHAFEEGVKNRSDADAARKWFAAAASGYDELWRRGRQTPALALNRGRTQLRNLLADYARERGVKRAEASRT